MVCTHGPHQGIYILNLEFQTVSHWLHLFMNIPSPEDRLSTELNSWLRVFIHFERPDIEILAAPIVRRFYRMYC